MPANQDSDFELSDWSKDIDPPVEALTREEAQALIARNPSMSVWQVVAAQALFGLSVALLWGGLSRSVSALLSSLYAVAVVVVPSLLMARGVFGRNARRGVGRLLVWEVLKLGLICALLALAPKLIRPLDWVALMVTLVLVLKVVGVVLLIGRRHEKKS
ncbi:MAG: ATP synthase subunit I [Aquabacterium sp.]|uniref:ATP synthase subunit I n=1 Tax=Aquabacterium sp. TaxID=1872578 RepID=UPI003BE7E0F6